MIRLLFTCVASLLLAGSTVVAADPPVFRAGAATNHITPPLGGSIVGGFGPMVASHIHDDLFARCIVLDDGKTQLALVVCDLLGIATQVTDEARKQIQEKTGIPAANILICATHTHSGVTALGQNRFATKPTLDEYQKFVVTRIVDGVRSAKNNLRPAEFAFGTVDIPEHVFNRRWHLKEGTMPANPFGSTKDIVKMNPGAGNPNLVKPAGPTDPAVSILSFRDPEGAPIAVLASYSLHYVGGVPSGHISSDYFGVFSKRMLELANRNDLDPPFVPIMANGTSGDINNINFREPRGRKAPYEQMKNVAYDVAEKVDQAIKGLKYRSDITLAAAYKDADIKFRQPSEEQLAWMEKTLAAGPQKPVDLSFIYAERARSIANQESFPPIPLQVLRIGDLCIGTMPCEVFVEIGQDFKKNCPIQPAFLMSLSHGYYGYLPPPHQHKLGGYETWLGTNRLEVEASDKMLAELYEMTRQVQPAAAPNEPAKTK
ncbi:MAG TPA: neutral/alkaline non-lysosomal ceramidase N-terminal domain-containing protein [Planctomicrobium sp.]|nr:neutral/alkaline non-lysosomal ceramidase N-terminal domain-containing protein [Planctomicrobium sp.]